MILPSYAPDPNYRMMQDVYGRCADHQIDIGVGVYKDPDADADLSGRSKAAETRILKTTDHQKGVSCPCRVIPVFHAAARHACVFGAKLPGDPDKPL